MSIIVIKVIEVNVQYIYRQLAHLIAFDLEVRRYDQYYVD